MRLSFDNHPSCFALIIHFSFVIFFYLPEMIVEIWVHVAGQEWKRCLALLLQTTSCLGKLISEPYTTRWPNSSGGTEERWDICLWWKDGKTAGYLGGVHPWPGWWNFWWSSVQTPQKCMKRCVLMGYQQPAASEQRFWRRPTVVGRPSVPAVAVRGTVPWRLQEFTWDDMHPRLHLHTLVGTWCSTVQV